MTASEIRQSFLDFFKEKQHSIVSSASLLPQSPGLLFTNAGMNQFVPYFLGVWTPPWHPARVADTQKCIRAGGKHNDLEDVGYDTSHHTFFEMLGNWSFGDYFKTEAIDWAWELIVERWKFPASRIYATVYAPDTSKGDPGSFDQEAWDCWAKHFRKVGLDPAIHIVNGNVKDNFWMMGETGPCGPCSELHVDLTPNGDTQGKLVNQDSDQCIEIWNLVFIQYNAESNGQFRNLPACHVDTGMGFERVSSMMQCTKGFTDFSQRISNYATDIFAPIFARITELSGKQYTDIYPSNTGKAITDAHMNEAIAFRVIADHLRTLSFSIADGILPGNNGRNYVLRRILRRAVRYGRLLNFQKPFLADLVDTLVHEMGSVFPELEARQDKIKEILTREEASFNETLDRGMELFAAEAEQNGKISGEFAFKLYDTFGFPLDLTVLIAAERQISVDEEGFEMLMEEQRQRARAARKSQIVRALDVKTDAVTAFIGDKQDECSAEVLEIIDADGIQMIITNQSPFYAEMGGQVGDLGTIEIHGETHTLLGVQQIGNARAHLLSASPDIALQIGDTVHLSIDEDRRRAIEANHSATHLLHKALHQIVSKDATQQGSFVSDERLRFDFHGAALSKTQLRAIEEQVNDWIKASLPVACKETPHADIKQNENITQFFGDKYGEIVRVIQIGGNDTQWDGISMELCGGTHVSNTNELGFFKIKSEGAIASGVRRIEAATGAAAYDIVKSYIFDKEEELLVFIEKIKEANVKLQELKHPVFELPTNEAHPGMKALEATDIRVINQALADFDVFFQSVKDNAIEAEKTVRKVQAAAAAQQADTALNELCNTEKNLVIHLKGNNELLTEMLNGLKKRHFEHSAFLVIQDGQQLSLGAYCGASALTSGAQAGRILQELASIVGGKGGGKPDQARGSAPQSEQLEKLLVTAQAKLNA